MSLFLEERIDEQKKKEEDPLEDKITFTRPWIIEILPPDDNDNQTIYFEQEFGTCYKFLQWTSLATRHSLLWLEVLLATIIANKFYFKWQQTFPENARNIENPLFLSIFGSESPEIFDRIDDIFEKSFLTNIILD